MTLMEWIAEGRGITATEIRLRQAEQRHRDIEWSNRVLEPWARSVAKTLFSHRNLAVFFGIKRRPITDDMSQMIEDLSK